MPGEAGSVRDAEDGIGDDASFAAGYADDSVAYDDSGEVW